MSNPVHARRPFRLALAVGLGLFLLQVSFLRAPAQVPDTIFFTAGVSSQSNTVRQIDLDGGNPRLIAGPLSFTTMEYSSSEAKLYGTGFLGDINRMNPDGTTIETMISGRSEPNSIRVDNVNGKIYWFDQGRLQVYGQEVRRANLDGSNMEVVVDQVGILEMGQLVIHPATNKLYVRANGDDYGLMWGDMDGGNFAVFAVPTGGVNPELSCPTIDDVNETIYWVQDGGSEVGESAIFRANLDGSNKEKIITLDTFPSVSCPSIDTAEGKIYWADRGGSTNQHEILRADLDGGNVEPVLANLNQPREVYFGDDDKLYWIGWDTNNKDVIQRGNRNGTGLEIVDDGFEFLRFHSFVKGLDSLYWFDQRTDGKVLGRLTIEDGESEAIRRSITDARTVALHEQSSTLYMADGRVISRINLDGSGLTTVITAADYTEALAVDEANGKIYWSESGSSRKIRRANLDGSNIEDLFIHTGAASAVTFNAIVLDVPADTLYFSYYMFGATGRSPGVWRARLNGDDAEELVGGLTNPRGLGIDKASGKIYWADSNLAKIMRANLSDGGAVETVYTRPAISVNSVSSLAVDAPNERLYWTDRASGQILRSDLEGENVEVLYDGPDAPYNLLVVAEHQGGTPDDSIIYLPITTSP